MDFLELIDQQGEGKVWLNSFLNLLEFFSKEELKWTSDKDDSAGDTYCALLPEKNINGGLKIRISIIQGDYTHCAINVGHHEDINIMTAYCLIEENRTEINFCKRDKEIKVVIFQKENELVKSKFEDLHDKLIRSRLGSRT